MASWKKIHEWVVKALEEPLLRAELHRAEICLPEKKEPEPPLKLVKNRETRDSFSKNLQINGGAN